MPIVSSSGQLVSSDVFIQGVSVYFTFSIVMKDLKKPCSHVIQYPLTQYVVSIVYSCMCAAGLFQRLLRPRWGRATKTAGDDGEQQLRVSNSRLWQNNWCVHRPYLYVYSCPLLSIIYCTHLVVFFSSSTNVLSVSGDTVAQTLFGLQIAGVQPGEIWPMEALL